MKRIVCLALVLVMILTLVPMTAFAAPTTLKIDRFNEYNSYDEVFAWSSDDESVTVETLYAGYPGGRTFEWYLKAWLVYDYETEMFVVRDVEGIGGTRYETEWELGYGSLIVMSLDANPNTEAVEMIANMQVGDSFYFGYENDDYESTFSGKGLVDAYLTTEKPDVYWSSSATPPEDPKDPEAVPGSYELSDDGTYYIFSEYIGTATEFAIPSEYNGLPVKEIGDYAFCDLRELEKVTIPDSVTSIGNYAFCDCYDLKSVAIPDSVTSIGSYAFFGCSNLEYTVYDNAKYLGSDSNPYIILVDAVEYDVPSCKIHKNTKFIHDSAFISNPNLESITIPDSVISIGMYAFEQCSNLKDITISASVKEIKESAFSFCSALDFITVDTRNGTYKGTGNCLIEIATKTLINGCSNSVIPADGSVTTIADRAFYSCDGLTDIVIPDAVTTIGDFVFFGCDSLANIEIGKSVDTIGFQAFDECFALESITVDEGNEIYKSVGNCLIETETKTLIKGSNNSVIPADGSVTSIAPYAFYNYDGLTEVIIPDSVTSIGYCAFAGCDGLTDIVIPSYVAMMDYYVFKECVNLTDIYCKATYQLDTWDAEWNAYCDAEIHWGYRESSKLALGDIDGDEDITAADYVYTKRAVMGTFVMTDVQKEVADIDKNGSINAADYVLLKRHVMGTYTIVG
jgi:hypothetical protein